MDAGFKFFFWEGRLAAVSGMEAFVLSEIRGWVPVNAVEVTSGRVTELSLEEASAAFGDQIDIFGLPPIRSLPTSTRE